MKMNRMLGLSAACFVIAVNAPHAQSPVLTDSAGPNEVTTVSIKSGKLALSSAANPGPVFLADGAYKNESNTVIVILDGRIVRIEYGSGTIARVASIRLHDERVMLTPMVSALMQVTPFPLPSGTFTSQDGALWLKVVSGRPAEFTVRASSPQH
jgi:hypothetical protein